MANQQDFAIEQLQKRSATLKWETGACMDGCRQRLCPMPRQTSCGRSSTPPAMTLKQVRARRSSRTSATELTHPLARR